MDIHPAFKTRLCKFYDTNTCIHGDKCPYAHGKHELRAFGSPKLVAPTPSVRDARAWTMDPDDAIVHERSAVFVDASALNPVDALLFAEHVIVACVNVSPGGFECSFRVDERHLRDIAAYLVAHGIQVTALDDVLSVRYASQPRLP